MTYLDLICKILKIKGCDRMSIKNNTASLQDLLDKVNALPEAGGVDLPELTNEGSAADLLSGKELIDGSGNIVTGTFSIDSELDTQDDLIAQIQSVVDSLPEAGGGSGGNTSYDTCTVNVSVEDDVSMLEIAYLTVDSNGKIQCIRDSATILDSYNLTCLCDSMIVIKISTNNTNTTLIESKARCYFLTENVLLCVITALKDEIATITLTMSSGGSGGNIN